MELAQLAQPLRERAERWVAAEKEEGKLPGTRMLFPAIILCAAGSSVLLDELCLAAHRRRFQQGSKRQFHSKRILDPRHQSRRQQRMPTQVEKVISRSDRLRVKHRFSYRNQFCFSGVFPNICILYVLGTLRILRLRLFSSLFDFFDTLRGQFGYPHLRLACCHKVRSEEHTSELQSRQYLVCRLLLEKKKKRTDYQRRLR